jgi:hypothetical protein
MNKGVFDLLNKVFDATIMIVEPVDAGDTSPAFSVIASSRMM